MSKKLALSLLLVMLGLATWDAVLEHEEYAQNVVSEDGEGQVRVMDDGTPRPTN